MAGNGNGGEADKAYEVTGQRPDFAQSEAGGFVQGVTITYRTAGGHTGQVFVPQEQYNLTSVQKLLSARAAEMDAIGNLTS